MRPDEARILVLAAALLATASPADADLFGRSQHGGRATGQAGAFVARADDAAAIRYNPAALVRLDGAGLLAGLDFDTPTDEASGPEGTSRAKHSIQFPPVVYFGWHPENARWAVGVGLDSPLWRLVNWDTALYPGRFDARRSDTRLFELRATGAWAIDERWSVGAALRAVGGDLGYGDAVRTEIDGAGGPFALEVDRTAEATGDGLGFDLALHFVEQSWGFGAVYSSSVKVEGSGDLIYLPRDLAGLPADAQATARARFRTGHSTITESLPARITVGAWWAPIDPLRLELDVESAQWSSAPEPNATHEEDVVGPAFSLSRRTSWSDTLAIRAGAELTLNETWSLGAGLALEPSPINDFEPTTPRGDAKILALGASATLQRITFDLGWSYHAFNDVKVQEDPPPAPRTTYTAHAQAWSISARWRL